MGKKSKKIRGDRGGSSNASGDTALKLKEKSSETIKSLFTDAEKALDSMQHEVAVDCYQQILKLDSENVDAMDMLGSVYSEVGSADDAKSLWLKCIELSPDNGYKKYFGLAQISEGKESFNFYEKGILLLEHQLEETENVEPEKNLTLDGVKLALSEGYCAVAELYMTDLCDEENAADLCKTAIDKSISIKPENPDSYRILASFLIIQDKLEEAKSAIQKNLDLWFTDYEALLDNPDDDVETELTLPEYSTRMEIGKVLVELEMYEQAVKILEGLLEEDDEVFLVWYLLGILYYSQGEKHYKTAFQYFTTAKEAARKAGQEDTDEALHINELLETLESMENISEDEENEVDVEENLSQDFSSEDSGEEEEEMMES